MRGLLSALLLAPALASAVYVPEGGFDQEWDQEVDTVNGNSLLVSRKRS